PRHLSSFPTRRSSDLRMFGVPILVLRVREGGHFIGNSLLMLLERRFLGVRERSPDLLDLGAKLLHRLRLVGDADLRHVDAVGLRSEEHTSELQSRENL